MGEAAWHVSLASGHVVNGAVHEEGCSSVAHVLQRRLVMLVLHGLHTWHGEPTQLHVSVVKRYMRCVSTVMHSTLCV